MRIRISSMRWMHGTSWTNKGRDGRASAKENNKVQDPLAIQIRVGAGADPAEACNSLS
jgi:hypothetical protein